MSKRNLTTGPGGEFAVITVDHGGNTATLPAKTKAAATRKANSLAKDGAYAEVSVVAFDTTPAGASDPQDEAVVFKGPGAGKASSKAAAPKEKHQCACGTVTAIVPLDAKLTPTQREYAVYEDDKVVLNTECTDLTYSRFAPGHDARYHGLERLVARVDGTLQYSDGPDAH